MRGAFVIKFKFKKMILILGMCSICLTTGFVLTKKPSLTNSNQIILKCGKHDIDSKETELLDINFDINLKSKNFS